MNKIYQFLSSKKTINGSLTRKVIELQSLGYGNDFQILGHREVLCLQDNQYTAIENMQIKVVDQGYDQLSKSFKYIHTIETDCGKRGLLLADRIVGLGLFPSKSKNIQINIWSVR
jgi:hypothetical protein